MRIAVIGANLLGSATALYTRRALDANCSDKADGSNPADSQSSTDEIVVFEKTSRTGGNKYATLKLGHVKACVGTACEVDIGKSPVIQALLNDAQIPLPQKQPKREWAIFDWDKDEYRVGRVRSRLLERIRSSFFLAALLQVLALVAMFYFYGLFAEKGFIKAFMKKQRREISFLYGRILFFVATVLLGGGVVPIGLVSRLYEMLFFNLAAGITANMTYGGYSLSMLAELITGISTRMQLVLERDAASSCITLGHLLSASGLAKYARASTTEVIAMYRLAPTTMDDIVAPGLSITYANSACKPKEMTNALATLFDMTAHCPMPVIIRSKSRYFDADQTSTLCAELIKKAGASLKLGTEVTSVTKTSNSRYHLEGKDTNHKLISLGEFDAVVLAAVVDPNKFTTDAVDEPLDQILSLDPALSGMPAGEVQIVNTARYVSLVEGDLNPDFFKKSTENGVPDRVMILNSVNCAEIMKLSPGVYRILSGEKPQQGSSVATTLFKNVRSVVSLERPKRTYKPTPLRNLHGSEAPEFVLGTRLLNAACVDRVANDPSLDVLSARNVASFFRDGVATWK